LLEDGFTVNRPCTRPPASYPPVPSTRAGRIDGTIYFNHATHRPERWKVSAKQFFCVCDLNESVPCNGVQIKRCPNLNTLNPSCVSTLSHPSHPGIGPGQFYSAQMCQDMWTEDGGLSVDLCGELKEAASILRERNTAGAYTYTCVHVYTYTYICVYIYSYMYNIRTCIRH
jgi:hypothetical protein